MSAWTLRLELVPVNLPYPEPLRDGRAWLGRLTPASSAKVGGPLLVSSRSSKRASERERGAVSKSLPLLPWDLLVRRRRYPWGKSIRACLKRFKCPKGCVPAARASALHDLPWTYHLVLTAPSDLFQTYMSAWKPGLDRLKLYPDRPEIA